MSGSMPEPDVVTASTGICAVVKPELYGRSSLRIAWMRWPTCLDRSGFVGPRFENVVPAALYAGEVADGRGWKYWDLENDWAASCEPTTLPPTETRLPSALPEKKS